MSTLRHTLTRLGSPQVGPLVLAAYLDLVTKNLHDGRFDLRADRHAILVEASSNDRDFEKAGVALFQVAGDARVLWVDLIYVREEYRGQGIARAMFGMLVNLAKQNEALAIRYGTHFGNLAMRGAAKRLGHKEEAIVITVPVAQE